MRSDHTQQHNHTPSRGRWVFLAFFIMAAALLFTEHRAHVLGVLPWLFLFLCPLMHIFMHGGHGHGAMGTAGTGTRRRSATRHQRATRATCRRGVDMTDHDSAYGLWGLVIINSAIFIMFAFTFFKPKTWRDWRSFGAFSAFLVALFAEMYGFPLTLYFLSGWLQSRYPNVDWFSHDAGIF